jgi:hypothetical protein
MKTSIPNHFCSNSYTVLILRYAPFYVMKIKCCSSFTEYRNEIGCFINFNIYHSWWHSRFLRKKVIMIRKLSISRSTYLENSFPCIFILMAWYQKMFFCLYFSTEFAESFFSWNFTHTIIWFVIENTNVL